jgi:hypothetical protein
MLYEAKSLIGEMYSFNTLDAPGIKEQIVYLLDRDRFICVPERYEVSIF